MTDGRDLERGQQESVSPSEEPKDNRRLVAIDGVRQDGGYIVGSVGWSGFAMLLTNRILTFLISGVVWMAGLVAWVVADESVRIGLRTALEGIGPEARGEAVGNEVFPLLHSDNRNNLETRWRQLLAEVQLEQDNYAPRLVRIVRDLTLEDIGRIDRMAPYVIGGAILRNEDSNNDHDVPDLQSMDFARLKTIGILEQGQFGQRIVSEPKNGVPASYLFRGTTLAMRVTADDPDEALEIPVTALTEEGEMVVRLLGRATSLSGLCNGAGRFEEARLNVQIGATFDSGEGAWSDPSTVREVTSLCLQKDQ